jgi:hypothetical protein
MKTWRDRSAISGSGEHISIQLLITPTIWLVASLGVRVESSFDSGGTTRGRVFCDVAIVPMGSYFGGCKFDKYEDSKPRTREWKCRVVIETVNMSY